MRRLKQDCAVRDSRCGPGGLRPPPDGNRRNAAMQQEERRRYLIGTLFAALTQMKKTAISRQNTAIRPVEAAGHAWYNAVRRYKMRGRDAV